MTSVLTPVAKRIKTGGTAGPKAPSTGDISITATYAVDEFQRRTRMGDGALRSAIRKGLKVTKIGNLRYVTGKSFADFVEAQAAK